MFRLDTGSVHGVCLSALLVFLLIYEEQQLNHPSGDTTKTTTTTTMDSASSEVRQGYAERVNKTLTCAAEEGLVEKVSDNVLWTHAIDLISLTYDLRFEETNNRYTRSLSVRQERERDVHICHWHTRPSAVLVSDFADFDREMLTSRLRATSSPRS